VEEVDWEPRSRRYGDEEVVAVRVGWEEKALQRRVREAGGRWDRGAKVWRLRYDRVVALGLEDRIVEEG